MLLRASAVVLAIAVLLVAVLVVALLLPSPRHFPAGSLSTDTWSDNFSNRWYSTQLKAMDEPVLYKPRTPTSYRFTWLRSFHHPIAIRITTQTTGYRLIAKELDSAGGYEPGSVLRRADLTLSQKQFAVAARLLQRPETWRPSPSTDRGRDGAEWVIEAADDGYRVTRRWSPSSGPVRDVGLEFLRLTGWQVPPDEIY